MGECSKNSNYLQAMYPESLYYREQYEMANLKKLKQDDLKKKAIMEDNQYIIDRLPAFINKENYYATREGKVMDVTQYDRPIYQYYDNENPFLTQGQQVVISSRALRELQKRK